MKNNKKLKIGRLILVGLLIFLGYKILFVNNFSYEKTITIKEGDTFQTFLEDLSWKTKIQTKIYIHHNTIDFSKLQMGSYIFSGEYSPKTFIETILAGPRVSYHTITILEGWSIYDIDKSLTNKGLISEGQYKEFVNDPNIISKYTAKYEFLPKQIDTLEGFLYPDTYKIDIKKNIIDQLVYLQLENFKKKIGTAYTHFLSSNGLNRYGTIVLASIVEKEERSEKNRPTVAGILLKRYQLGTLVGADISLCYFFEMPYSDCTPSFIAKKVADGNNPYNTRAVKGLPPTPVSNPSISSILAVLQPKTTEYFYYLHDNQGQIHYGKTLEEHNLNKKNYLY